MMRMKCVKVQVIGAAVCAMALLAGCQSGAKAAETPAATVQAETESAAETETVAKTESVVETGTAAETVDAVSSASQMFYQEASFDHDRLWDSIGKFEGSCTIATVNEDGTPNLIVAVPGTAGDSHLYFNWADNGTKANVQRTGEAMLSYYVYHPEAEEKMERNQGARIKVSLETDQAVLEQLQKENPACSAVSTVLRVEEILPIG